ncbi:MAG: DUF115 domain-containing protein [Defluviitaleaceae bacterium]|nr:DUF115 domain-containing protein [Defluviitaleaceae bacterium]
MKIDWTQTESLMEKNIRFIENSPRIVANTDFLRNLNETDYRILPCEDGANFTIEKKTEEGGYIRMHSLYEPMREGQLLAQRIVTEENAGKLYVRFGFGFGYLYNYMLPMAAAQKSYVLIYEPCYEIFNYFIRLFDISKFFEGYDVRLFVGNHHDDVSVMFPYLNEAQRAKTYSNHLMGYFSFYKEMLENCVKVFDRFFKYGATNRNTKRFFAEKWAMHLVKNMHYIFKEPWYKGLKGVLDGRPAVLVSAGPSLNKNIQLLKEIQGKVFIVAAYSSVKTFEANGVKPDMFMALDAIQAAYPVGEEYGLDEISLFLHPSVPREMFEHHKENNFIFVEYGSYITYFLGATGKNIKNDTFDVPGGSVAHSIANLLKYMGAGTIVMIGQDLAHTGNQHHAKEYMEGLNEFWTKRAESVKAVEVVEDVFGDMVETSGMYNSFRESFEQFAKRNLDNFEMIDATEGGAKIENTKIMSLREAIDTYMLEYTDDSYTSKLIAHARENGELFNDEEKEKVCRVIKDMVKQCANIEELTDDALKASEKVLKLFKHKKIPTNQQLAKHYVKYRSLLIEKILKNDLVINAVNPKFFADYQESEVMRREEDHQVHFFVRTTSNMLKVQRKNVEAFAQACEETLDELKREGYGNAD